MYMALGVFSIEAIDGHWYIALLKIDTIFKALRSSYVLGSCYLPGVIREAIIADGIGSMLNGCTSNWAFAEAGMTAYDPHAIFDWRRQSPLTYSQNWRDIAVTSN
jgi:hypothetical protein